MNLILTEFCCLLQSYSYQLLIRHFFKDAIASNQNEIVTVLNFEGFYVRCWNHDTLLPTVPWIFGLNISDCS